MSKNTQPGSQLSPSPSAEASASWSFPPAQRGSGQRTASGRLGSWGGLWGGGGAWDSTSNLRFMGNAGAWPHSFGSAHSVGKMELQRPGIPRTQGQASGPVPLWLSPSPFPLQNTTHPCPAPCLVSVVSSVVPLPGPLASLLLLLFSPDPKFQAEGVATLLDFRGSAGGDGGAGPSLLERGSRAVVLPGAVP